VPETLLALTLAKKFILIGDHLQLPPIVGGDSTEEWIKESLFEKLWRMYPEKHTMLNTQYRMDEKISEISSKNIYGKLGGIITSESVLKRKNPFEQMNDFSLSNDEKKLVSKTSPICWLHVNGDIKWINNGPSHSANNIAEIENIEKVLDILVNKEKVEPNRIGVLSPFRYQVSSMINAFEEYVEKGVVINTIHSFQGDEKDIVIISLVTEKIDSSRIYEDIRLLNVAITRSKFKLIIVGNTKMTAKKNNVSEMLADLRETAIKCNGHLANNALRPDSNVELRVHSEKETHFAKEANEIAQLKKSTFSRGGFRY
jgi:DNA replication ATP-dependent helicase Dna2